VVYAANWVIIYHLPPIKGTRNSYWLLAPIDFLLIRWHRSRSLTRKCIPLDDACKRRLGWLQCSLASYFISSFGLVQKSSGMCDCPCLLALLVSCISSWVFAHGAQEQPFPPHTLTGLLHVLDCDGAKSQTLKVSQFSPKSFKTEYFLNVTNGSWCLFLSIRSILVFFALILIHIILQDPLPTKLELMMNRLSRNEPKTTVNI